MKIADQAVLVTGANRGIGQRLVDEALRRGARRVYAGTRQPYVHPDERVTPLTLDVTSAAQIRAAVECVESLEEEIFPDPMSESIAESWRGGAVKALERENAALVQSEPVAS